MQSRNWVFTLNNPDICPIPNSLWEKFPVKIAVYQLERGEEGTEHLQGYVEMKHGSRLAAMKKLLPRAHWEIRRGSRLEAIQYCVKEDSRIGNTYSFGLDEDLDTFVENLRKKSNGKSTSKKRLIEVKSLIENGTSVEDIATNDDYFDLWVRHHRAFERFALLKTPGRRHEVKVIVCVGSTGTGKSRFADTFGGAYWKPRGLWWDGYSNHRTVILDEFYGWLPFDTLLRICDRYPLQVETKGGTVQFVADTIVFTSNKLPRKWYKEVYFDSFARRVSEWKYFGHNDQVTTFVNEHDFNAVLNQYI